ncbi:MAG: FKBP-type peptidyl-prolyl cis-trans isomerase [Sandaracinaceae bacterium]|nr:FKBP-type peptidyl-prolyl cis-trans isomerase [Sandaracinaceae bacterium]
MKIAAASVVTLDYVLKDEKGVTIDESAGHPLVYLHGHDMIVPGLENALAGHAVGDNVKVAVPPGEGYGERGEEQPMSVPLDRLPKDIKPEAGMMLDAVGPDGNSVTLWIMDVKPDAVLVTAEHPLAGVTLHFDVTVKEVRAATKEELEHGHAHGEGGHHH